MTTVILVFSLAYGLVPNPSQDQNNRWQGCQGGDRIVAYWTVWTYGVIPEETNFICKHKERTVITETKTLAFFKGTKKPKCFPC